MKASIHISTRMVEVLTYTKTGSSVSVKDYNTYPLPEECVINGVILDGTQIIEGLRLLSSSRPQVFKDTSLVLDGSFVYTKKITVPSKLNKWMYNQVIRDEFSEVATDAENLLCDYYPLGINEDGSREVLACAVERAHVETYLSIIKSAGIKVRSVHLGVNAILKYIGNHRELHETPFVLNLVDGEILLSMIFQKGVNVFQSRTRLYGEDRATLVQNTLDGLSGIIQFNKTQNFDDIKNCFYLGLSDSDMDLVRMNTTYPDINFYNLELFKNVRGADILPPDAHFAYLNALMSESEHDLLDGIKMLEKVKKRLRPRKRWIPILVLLVVLLVAVIGVLAFLVIGVNREVRELNNYLNSPQVLSEKGEITSLTRDTSSVSLKHSEAKEQIDEDAAMPVLTRELIETIVNTGGTSVSVSGFTFVDKEGTVRVTATAIDEFAASSYVERLRSNAMIEYVEYLGYASDAAGTFSFSIEVKAH